MATTSVWMYKATLIEGINPEDISGFGVEAIDGSIARLTTRRRRRAPGT